MGEKSENQAIFEENRERFGECAAKIVIPSTRRGVIGAAMRNLLRGQQGSGGIN
ncbi:hypothetical protein [Aquisalimonas sp.]|uniref:hypothetical protein n=1 Tax=Aquisalimonas sp. TaxID=1872621 RepID=UPI0025C1D228|nr:hypothetical protein [Aquisalimonas sp.]